MKRVFALFIAISVICQTTSLVYAAELKEQFSTKLLPESRQESFMANLRLIEQKNESALLAATTQAQSSRRTESSVAQKLVLAENFSLPSINEAIVREADYVLASQFLSPGDPAHGAINNVYGSPTWIVPRENALAILNLIESAESTGNTSYLDRAALAADYLVRVQDQTDGGWFDQYDHANPTSFSKSPTQTAEVMIAFFKLGYSAARYESMKKGMQYLLACQDPANKGGFDDGLLGGGKDGNGGFHTWRWASDNSFAYQAFKAMQAWANVAGDSSVASQAFDASAKVLNGINTSLYIDNPSDPNYGVWKRAIDRFGLTMEPDFVEWINYAPQMLDLPAIGVGSQRVGEWIHNNLQREDGAVVWDTTWHSTRKSPGFSFQAAMVWRDLGQNAYADAAIDWAVNHSGLWQTTPDQNGIVGGWIDWVEPNEQAPFWQRFIDTSFYSTTAFKGGYNFNIGEATSYELLGMRLQGNDQWRNDFNLIYGTHILALGKISSADTATLQSVVYDPNLRFETFFTVLTKAASLYRNLTVSSGRLSDFNLLYGSSIQSVGALNAADRGKLFDVVGDPAYSEAVYLPVLAKAASLFRAIQPSSSYRTDFNLLFKTAITASGSPIAVDRAVIFGVAGDPVFNQTLFLPVLTKTASLYRLLQATASYRTDFNLLFGTQIQVSGSPTTTDKTILFGVTGDPGYNQTNFLSVQTKTASLYRNLQANATYRANFNLLYGGNIIAVGVPSAADRTSLFGVAGSAGYSQSAYLSTLTQAAGLYQSLQGSSVYRADFNLLYGSKITVAGAPNAVDRGALFDVAGASGFNLSKYLPVLRKTSSLYTALQGNTAKRNSFNTRYKTALKATGSPVAKDRGVMFNIAGSPTYNEAKFLATL